MDEVVQNGLLLFLLCSGVPLAVGSIAAVSLAVLQSATQVQEQTVQFLVRAIGVGILLLLGGKWGFARLVDLLQKCLLLVGTV